MRVWVIRNCSRCIWCLGVICDDIPASVSRTFNNDYVYTNDLHFQKSTWIRLWWFIMRLTSKRKITTLPALTDHKGLCDWWRFSSSFPLHHGSLRVKSPLRPFLKQLSCREYCLNIQFCIVVNFWMVDIHVTLWTGLNMCGHSPNGFGMQKDAIDSRLEFTSVNNEIDSISFQCHENNIVLKLCI